VGVVRFNITHYTIF